jgi:ADP-heptose:LPS heptosyltransferase
MVHALKFNYPDAEIDFLVNKRVFELVQDYPNINKVHAIEKDSLKDILRICKGNKYDTAIIVKPLFVIALAVFLSRIKYRVGTAYRWYSFLFNLKHYQHRKFSKKHELEYNLDLLAELRCKRIDNINPKLEVSENLTEVVKGKISKKGIDPQKDFIIIHPGSLGSALRWKAENFIELVDLLAKDEPCRFNILITGTKSDEVILNSLAESVTGKDNIFIINDLGLKEFSALCKLAKMFVSNSTGPIHIAAAAGTFCVGFYSPVRTESAVRWAPYTDKRRIFTPQIGGEKVKGDVMDEIEPGEVFAFIKNYMLTN